ncbi:MAG: 3-hydroxyacyl-ACP dehydratase FabZ [Deltaproteobacteria bacterium]|nr:3-hydroxyacyl-ACP dehydratase FabZ [Deltaproteobacteria bacterium]
MNDTPVPPAPTVSVPVADAADATFKPLKYTDIIGVLPHRYPFLLVDRVVAVEPGKRVRAYKNVSANEEFFNGHFPGMPVMPGVLQIEALAQASAFLTASMEGFEPKKQVAFLMSIDEVKFRRLVEPGDRLDLEVELLQSRRGIVKVQGKSSVDGDRACEAVITAAIRDRPGAG